jgi:hypothetical protein
MHTSTWRQKGRSLSVLKRCGKGDTQIFAQEKREGWYIPVPVGVPGLVWQVGGGCGAVVDAVHEPGEEAAVQLLG